MPATTKRLCKYFVVNPHNPEREMRLQCVKLGLREFNLVNGQDHIASKWQNQGFEFMFV